jgi:hypothetical protein
MTVGDTERLRVGRAANALLAGKLPRRIAKLTPTNQGQVNPASRSRGPTENFMSTSLIIKTREETKSS